MKSFSLGKIDIKVDDYASQGNAILGIRDSGKSYTATAIAEKLMDAGIPIIVFDPIGIWRNLRVPGAGKGYKVVVAGGRNGDLPLTPRGAQEIVRAAMTQNVSLIVDLYDIHLSKADWREVVATSIRTLLYENGDHGLRHIFIEEAAEFCPQVISPDQGRVYAEVEKLARMGGNALLGYTLINQRAEQVNKAVLELCDCMILHRQKGRNSLTALEKWLTIASTHDSKALISSLPGLANGEAWVWPAGADAPVRTRIPEKNSFHPDRRARQTVAKVDGKEVDVSAFVATMQASLVELTEEAEANDPKILRRRIADLEREAKKPKELTVDTESLAREYLRGNEEGYKVGHAAAIESVRDVIHDQQRVLAASNDALIRITTAPPPLPHRDYVSQTHPKRIPNGMPVSDKRAHSTVIRTLSKVETKFLTVLAQQDRSLSRNQIAIFAGYSSKSGHVDNTLSSLRTQGFIEGTGDSIRVTGKGKLELGPFAPLPTGQELRDYWVHNLDKACGNFLTVLFDAYPKTLSRDEIARRAGYSESSGHVDNTLSALRTRDLIIGTGANIRASADLFE